MEMHMINLLMRNPSVVLKDIVVFDTLSNCDLLRHCENLGQLVVGNVMQLCAMMFRNDKLQNIVRFFYDIWRIGRGDAYRVSST